MPAHSAVLSVLLALLLLIVPKVMADFCCSYPNGGGWFGNFPLTELKPAVSGKLEGKKRDRDETKPENLAMMHTQFSLVTAAITGLVLLLAIGKAHAFCCSYPSGCYTSSENCTSPGVNANCCGPPDMAQSPDATSRNEFVLTKIEDHPFVHRDNASH
ncbi:hypothetical protein BDZ90DRAFT_228607 [Jaminaea rosea]|uniref:Hydrophobin n=1 Tax=Jaminaea rosea TaxID=1569628 RepID=A0A316UHV0_9BASI|nr:hypothetical protein BDZ90DRAFT_228607 [Jaminaea rosea]PWN24917.1 hypothetical protein BDZ90DRAFT_228607 [Jaminaea rosea]